MRSSHHRTVTVDVDAPPAGDEPDASRIPWWITAGVGGAGVVAATWILMLGTILVGWLASTESPLSGAGELASDIVLLAHGAELSIYGIPVSFAPLGLSIIMIFLGQPLATHAAKNAVTVIKDPIEALWKITCVFSVSWLVAMLLVATTTSHLTNVVPAIFGSVVMAGIAGWWGANRRIDYSLTAVWPRWLRALPWAMLSSAVVCLLGGVVVLAMALADNTARIAAIHDGLQPGLGGTIALTVAQVLYLPNLVVWATAWLLGGDLTLGDDSLISLGVTDAGFLPAIPISGAIPHPGAASPVWMWWLVIGVLAGAIAAFVIAWARPRARFDETGLVGGLAAVAAGGCIAVMAWISSGALGSERLAYIGPDLASVIVVAPSLMGLTGIVVGVLIGLARTYLSSGEPAAAPPDKEES